MAIVVGVLCATLIVRQRRKQMARKMQRKAMSRSKSVAKVTDADLDWAGNGGHIMSINPVAAASRAALAKPQVIVRQSAPEQDALKGQQDAHDKMFWQPTNAGTGDRTAQEAADALLQVRSTGTPRVAILRHPINAQPQEALRNAAKPAMQGQSRIEAMRMRKAASSMRSAESLKIMSKEGAEIFQPRSSAIVGAGKDTTACPLQRTATDSHAATQTCMATLAAAASFSRSQLTRCRCAAWIFKLSLIISCCIAAGRRGRCWQRHPGPSLAHRWD